MKFHPAANLFPLMEGDAFEAFADDIREHGLREEIELLDGEVLDGRNRLRACELVGIEPRFHDLDLGPRSPIEYVISVNLHRRHLTRSQRAVVAVEALPLLEAEARERMLRGTRSDPGATSRQGPRQPKAAARAAENVGVGERIVQEAKAVKKQAPDLFEKVKAGEMTVHTAAKQIGRASGGHGPKPSKAPLPEVLHPLHKWLKDWDGDDDRLRGIWPKDAKKLLVVVSETRDGLFELERALAEKTVVSRALR